MNSYVLFGITFVIFSVSSLPTDINPELERNENESNSTYFMELECNKAGGMCLPASECPDGLLSETKGLCPQQQSLGIECCHGLSIRERRCGARGGICRPSNSKCGRELMLSADDCPSGHSCCALV